MQAVLSPTIAHGYVTLCNQTSSRTWPRVAVLVDIEAECPVPGYLSKLPSVLAPKARSLMARASSVVFPRDWPNTILFVQLLSWYHRGDP